MSLPPRVFILVFAIAAGCASGVVMALPAMAQQTPPDRSYMDRLERGVEFYSRKSYSEAASYLETLTQSDPGRKEAFLWLGHARAQLNDWAAARAAYKRYAELAPTDIEGPRGVARTYEAEGQRDLALLWYQQASQLEPTNAELRESVSRLEASKGANNTPPASPAVTDSGAVSASAASESSSATPGAGTPTTDNTGFWQQLWRGGIAELTGARSVWWGRLLVLFLFLGSLIQGAAMHGKTTIEKIPRMPRPVLFLLTLVGASVTYVIWWGRPSGWTWGLAIACLLLSMIAVNYGAQQAR